MDAELALVGWGFAVLIFALTSTFFVFQMVKKWKNPNKLTDAKRLNLYSFITIAGMLLLLPVSSLVAFNGLEQLAAFTLVPVEVYLFVDLLILLTTILILMFYFIRNMFKKTSPSLNDAVGED